MQKTKKQTSETTTDIDALVVRALKAIEGENPEACEQLVPTVRAAKAAGVGWEDECRLNHLEGRLQRRAHDVREHRAVASADRDAPRALDMLRRASDELGAAGEAYQRKHDACKAAMGEALAALRRIDDEYARPTLTPEEFVELGERLRVELVRRGVQTEDGLHGPQGGPAHLFRSPQQAELALPLLGPPSRTFLEKVAAFFRRQQRGTDYVSGKVDDESPQQREQRELHERYRAKQFRREVDRERLAALARGDFEGYARAPVKIRTELEREAQERERSGRHAEAVTADLERSLDYWVRGGYEAEATRRAARGDG